jgi:hypothetical protein
MQGEFAQSQAQVQLMVDRKLQSNETEFRKQMENELKVTEFTQFSPMFKLFP